MLTNPLLLYNVHVELTEFLLVGTETPLVDCGIACSKRLTDCNTFYVSGLQCHLLEVRNSYLHSN